MHIVQASERHRALLACVDFVIPLGHRAGVIPAAPGLLAPQRQALILQELTAAGAVRVSDLVRRLGVSDMTIRRDLDSLAARGLIDKVHGGATLPEPVRVEGGRADTSRTDDASGAREAGATQKEAIARAAATLVAPGDVIGIGAGSTTVLFARELANLPGLTVVTNSMPVAEALLEAEPLDRTIVMTGGECTQAGALVGAVTVASLRTLHVDVAFLGAHGLDLDAGITTRNLLMAETNRAMVAAARRLVVLADSRKWGAVGLSRYARLDEVDVVVSDAALPREAQKSLAARSDVLIAEPAVV